MSARPKGGTAPMTLAGIAAALGASWFTIELVELAFTVLR
jgi:hypothetical protein